MGIWADLAALGLAVDALLGAFWVHHFWTDADETMQRIEMTNFMRKLSIAGAGIALFALFAMVRERSTCSSPTHRSPSTPDPSVEDASAQPDRSAGRA